MPTNSIPTIPADALPQGWSHYVTAINALILLSGFIIRHVVAWWLDSGGCQGVKLKFKYGNQIPKLPPTDSPIK